MSSPLRKQVLLLIDTAWSTPGASERVYLACCRLLFSFTEFSSSKAGKTENVQWDWQLFDSNAPRVPVRTSSPTFKDLRTEILQKFQQNLKDKFTNSTRDQTRGVGVASLKVVLATALQDYQWDTPIIMSPVVKYNKKRTLGLNKQVTNTIFLISERFEDIATSWGMGVASGRSLTKHLKEELLPSAVCTQLYNKNIKLVAVCGNGNEEKGMASRGYIREVENVFTEVGGCVFPMCLLVTPPVPHPFLVLPPEIMGGAYLTGLDERAAVVSRHFMVNKSNRLTVLELHRINDCCSIPLFEEGPVLFDTLGLASIPPIEHCLTVYTCIGISDNIQHQGVLDYYKNSNLIGKGQERISLLFNENTGSGNLKKTSDPVKNMSIGRKRKRKSEEKIKESKAILLPVSHNAMGVATNVSMETTMQNQPVAHSVSTMDERGMWAALVNKKVWSGGLSENYENLNLFLAKAGMVLVLGVYGCHGNCNRVAVLQPLTPLVSSLSLIKPDHTQQLLSVTKPDSSPLPPPSSSLTTHTDLTLSLHSWFPPSHDKSHDQAGSPGCLWSSLLPTTPTPKERFSYEYLTQWSHLLPKYGISKSDMGQLRKRYCDLSVGGNKSAKLLSQLKKLYSPDKLGGLIRSRCINRKDKPVEKCAPPTGGEEGGVANFDDITKEFNEGYSNHLSLAIDETSWLQWTITITNKLSKITDSDDDMWAGFNKWLLSDGELKKLHLNSNKHAKMINEYILQVLLHFSCCNHLTQSTEPILIEGIVPLLRRLSLLRSPAYVGQLLKDTLVPNFSNNCVGVLKEVYTNLMLPLPQCIHGDGSSSESDSDTLVLDTENEEEGVPRPFNGLAPTSSLETFLENKNDSKKLKRHASFNRQISISRHPSLMSTKKDKRVRRSLFERSLSCGGEKQLQRQRKNFRQVSDRDGRRDVVVKETPRKKQVKNYRKFKLERLRSKTNIIRDEVKEVVESPERSFYSIVRNSETSSANTAATKTIVFKTPPSKVFSPRVMECGAQLSSNAIRSLLEGEFSSPFSNDTPTNSQKTALAQQSPELFNTDSAMATPTNIETPSRLIFQYGGGYKEPATLNSPKIVIKRINSHNYPNTPPMPLHHKALPTDPDNIECVLGNLAGNWLGSNSDLFGENCTTIDSASMAAFALSTPTKTDLFDFSNCLEKNLS